MPCDAAQELFVRGNSFFMADDLVQAAECYRRALELESEFAAASFNLGCTLHRLAGPAEALPHFSDAARLRPDWCEARSNLGFALASVGRMAEAAVELEAASTLRPSDSRIRNDLGLALSALGKGEQAHASFREALRLDPHNPEIHNNLGILFDRFGRSSEAIASFREALRLRPDYPEAHNNIAGALKGQGRHDEALPHLQEALRLRPDYGEALHSLLFLLCYPAHLPEEDIFAEHLRFGAACRFPLRPHGNDPARDRALRIGYVSADFRDHAVARFIEPVLRHHDRRRFRIFCYSNASVTDARSAAIAQLCDRFANIAGMPDPAAEEMIREDGIDILVDLSGHSAGNRLLLFARKPAPVQVTWLGYPQTTGLDAIDYRITDAIADPPGAADRLHAEKLLRLCSNFSCFAPDADAPEVGDLPLAAGGIVTFGSFNNPAKISAATVALWASVLHAVPGSRLLVKGYSLADGGTRERLEALFAAQGITPDRLELTGNTATYREHLALYRRVDIALDTFPYNGTTTTCEALWMGVPVVTLAGDAHRSRVGASLLATVGLPDLVGRDAQGYTTIAAALARDRGRLERLRNNLRSMMGSSPLTDGARFTRDLESAYLGIWGAWCAQRGERGAAMSRPHPDPEASVEKEGGLDQGEGGCTLRPGSAAGVDQEMGQLLSRLRADATDPGALGRMEQLLNEETASVLREALNEDAIRLGAPPLPASRKRSADATLAEAAELLLRLGLLTPADLICRHLLDRGYEGAAVRRTLGEIALRIGRPAHAARYFREAQEAGDQSLPVRIGLVKAEESTRHAHQERDGKRYLLIKAWGYGFWSDVNHVLGQLLLAEITGRSPVIHWGGNSLFSDDPGRSAFDTFFEPVSQTTLADLVATGESFYPPKWNSANLTCPVLNQGEGPWSRSSSLYTFERVEDVVVSDFHYGVNDLLPWIPAQHHLHGLATDEVYRYLFRHYVKVKRDIVAGAEDFHRAKMAGRPHLALHVRGGDKGGEDANLARLNELYIPEIERYLELTPQGRLFLLTDDSDILSGYLRRYGERVVHTAALRTGTGEGVHYRKHPSRHRLGVEVIIDALLAIRCDAFVGNGLSNVSCAIAQMKEWRPGSVTLLGARLDRLRNFTLYRS